MATQITEVMNIHRDPYDIYIGRPGHGLDGYFGNYEQGQNRYELVEAFRGYFFKRIQEDEKFRSAVEQLRGKRLGCFCVPLLCHGMVIVEHLEGFTYEQQIEAYKKKYMIRPTKKIAHQPMKWVEPDMFDALGE